MTILGWELGKKYKAWGNIDEVIGFRYHAGWKAVMVVVKGQDGTIREHLTLRSKHDREVN